MQIKVFKASSMKEAVAKMKDELGDDAVILHTKKYKEGGILGYGSKEMVEITAAIEDEKPAPKKEPEKPQRPTIPVMPQSVLSQYKTNGTAEGVALAEKELSKPSLIDQPNSTIKNDDNLNISTMQPSSNQASSLKAAMNPSSRPSRPDPPMPYDDPPYDIENSPMPYEVEFSSRNDLNTPKNDQNNSSEIREDEKNLIQSHPPLIDESAIENEPDENVYSAEPPIEKSNSEVNLSENVNSTVPPSIESDSTVSNVVPENIQTQSTAPTPSTINNSEVQAPPQPQPQIIPQPQQIQQSQVQMQQPQSQIQSQPQQQNFSQQPTQPVQPIQVVSTPPPQQQPIQQVQPVQYQSPTPQQQPLQQVHQVPQNQYVQPQQPTIENPAPPQPQQIQNSQDQAANVNQQSQQQIDMNQPMTPAQLAQAQAMMMAQFNQLQMAQAMQQAMAQAQAQAQAQVQSMTPPPTQAHSQSESHEVDRESQEKIKRLENEIAQMKALLAQVIGKDSKRGTISLHEALKNQEVNEEILNDMAAHSEAGGTLADSQSREAKTILTKFLNENINFSEGIKLNRHGVRIAALLGTTGVGKTTTLAKIAAKFVLEQGITAALITADTYRISAVEQLRTYSEILGLPLEIVYSPAELSKAINKHRNRDLILIDTAGRSQHNDYQMKELQEFLAANQRIEKHLVLSTTTKISDAEDILEKFSICEPDKVIFTKTDETASTGLIVNLLYKKRLAISYVTNGQSVPDDITPATAETLADLLLKRNLS